MQTLNIFQSLLFIQDKHAGYFHENKKTIMNYIHIEWTIPLRVALTEYDIPTCLKNDIETLILPINNLSI
jgi:hypothetical protein